MTRLTDITAYRSYLRKTSLCRRYASDTEMCVQIDQSSAKTDMLGPPVYSAFFRLILKETQGISNLMRPL